MDFISIFVDLERENDDKRCDFFACGDKMSHEKDFQSASSLSESNLSDKVPKSAID